METGFWWATLPDSGDRRTGPKAQFALSLTGTVWETPEQGVRSASFHCFDPKAVWLTAPKYVNIS